MLSFQVFRVSEMKITTLKDDIKRNWEITNLLSKLKVYVSDISFVVLFFIIRFIRLIFKKKKQNWSSEISKREIGIVEDKQSNIRIDLKTYYGSLEWILPNFIQHNTEEVDSIADKIQTEIDNVLWPKPEISLGVVEEAVTYLKNNKDVRNTCMGIEASLERRNCDRINSTCNTIRMTPEDWCQSVYIFFSKQERKKIKM